MKKLLKLKTEKLKELSADETKEPVGGSDPATGWPRTSW